MTISNMLGNWLALPIVIALILLDSAVVEGTYLDRAYALICSWAKKNDLTLAIKREDLKFSSVNRRLVIIYAADVNGTWRQYTLQTMGPWTRHPYVEPKIIDVRVITPGHVEGLLEQTRSAQK